MNNTKPKPKYLLNYWEYTGHSYYEAMTEQLGRCDFTKPSFEDLDLLDYRSEDVI